MLKGEKKQPTYIMYPWYFFAKQGFSDKVLTYFISKGNGKQIVYRILMTLQYRNS